MFHETMFILSLFHKLQALSDTCYYNRIDAAGDYFTSVSGKCVSN